MVPGTWVVLLNAAGSMSMMRELPKLLIFASLSELCKVMVDYKCMVCGRVDNPVPWQCHAEWRP